MFYWLGRSVVAFYLLADHVQKRLSVGILQGLFRLKRFQRIERFQCLSRAEVIDVQ